jgi:hypothetical protein
MIRSGDDTATACLAPKIDRMPNGDLLVSCGSCAKKRQHDRKQPWPLVRSVADLTEVFNPGFAFIPCPLEKQSYFGSILFIKCIYCPPSNSDLSDQSFVYPPLLISSSPDTASLLNIPHQH